MDKQKKEPLNRNNDNPPKVNQLNQGSKSDSGHQSLIEPGEIDLNLPAEVIQKSARSEILSRRGQQIQHFYSQKPPDLNPTLIASLSQGYQDNSAPNHSQVPLRDDSSLSGNEEDNDDVDADAEEMEEEIDSDSVQHIVGEILEVKLQPNLDLTLLVGNNLSVFQNGINNLQSTMFMVDWQCKCCSGGKRKSQDSWLYMSDLIETYGVDSDKLRSLEQIAIRELRERETKKHAKELTKYLNFEDVDDFTQAEFEEKNFSPSQSSIQSNSLRNSGQIDNQISQTDTVLDQLENRLNQCPVINNKQNSKLTQFQNKQCMVFEKQNQNGKCLEQQRCEKKADKQKKQNSNDSWENHVTMEYQCDSRETSNNQSQKITKNNENDKILGKRDKPNQSNDAVEKQQIMIQKEMISNSQKSKKYEM